MITYKFRLYPNKEHREKLDYALDKKRFKVIFIMSFMVKIMSFMVKIRGGVEK